MGTGTLTHYGANLLNDKVNQIFLVDLFFWRGGAEGE